MNLTPEEKAVGQDNYHEALGVSRRDFLKQVVGTSVVSGAGLGAMYFGYGSEKDIADPVRIGIIGTGDEGGVLIGALSPGYVQVVAIADIRPSSIHRAFHGDWSSPAALAARPGLMAKYDWKSEDEARKHVKVETDYKKVIHNPDVEAVIIALPLHLHHPASMEAMAAGKHVLTEKLMAHNVGQCKEMARTARDKKILLATGHQRHYSILYDNAVNLLRWGILGEIQFIRAQWHRGNLPGRDSWQQPLPGGEWTKEKKKKDVIANKLKQFQKKLKRLHENVSKGKKIDPVEKLLMEKKIAQWMAWDSDKGVNADNYGYQSMRLPNGRERTALEELCRWRLWDRTGGGLMAELGSHQLDAASIFISALRKDGNQAHPLTVHAVGGRYIFPLDRDADDHVYCTFEFPGPGYDAPPEGNLKKYGYYDEISGYPKQGIPSFDKDTNKKIIVTYSSIMGNGFGGYGETVMGSKGTLILEREKEVMLFKNAPPSTRIKVSENRDGPTLDTSESVGPAAAVAQAAAEGPVSRGYTEEIEHWAWCIRHRAAENQPKCNPEIALADAVIALTTKLAIKRSNEGKGGYVQFEPEWFDVDSKNTPEKDLA